MVAGRHGLPGQLVYHQTDTVQMETNFVNEPATIPPQHMEGFSATAPTMKLNPVIVVLVVRILYYWMLCKFNYALIL